MKKKFVLLLLGFTLVFVNSALAIYTNGGFESGDFTGWTTGFGLNDGLTGAPPFNEGNIVITPGGVQILSTVGAISDPRTDNLLVLPRFGSFSAKINDETGGQNLNFIRQADTIKASDRDPGDNKLHVRFSYAAVLEDPGHLPDEQPYFHVSLKNLTKGTTIFDDFTYSNQPGKTFNTSNFGGSTWKWTNWQSVDIVIPDADLGDNLEITALAADCSLGGHGGYVYLDGFGSASPPPPPPPPEANVSIPTMTEWGMIFMILLLGGTAIFYLRRKRTVKFLP